MRKTNEHDHAKNSSDDAQGGTDFARRRKIMLGLASAPVVMTVSNAAMANASSHQCVTNTIPGTEPACIPFTDAASANTAQATLNNNFWAAGPVNTDNNTGTGVDLTGLNNNLVSGADQMCVPSGDEPTPDILQITGYRQPGGNYIDQDGGAATAGNPLSASCLASFT